MSQHEESRRWHLLRAVVLSVGDPPQEFKFGLRQGHATAGVLRMVSVDGKPAGMLAVAAVPLDTDPTLDESFKVPEAERREAEGALELLCRIVALDRGATHRISSPSPCLGLHCSDASQLEALDGTPVGIHSGKMTLVGVGEAGVLRDEQLVALLSDRVDGVVMLTEALNAQSPVGQFTQFWRFFERSFHRGYRAAAPLMLQFLKDGPHGFGLDEIELWADNRNPSIHADRHQTPTLDSDVQPFVGRMREAAYDVLLNKAEWSSTSVDRHEAWKPGAGSSGRSGGVFGIQGRTWELRGQLLDDFASFPMLLAGPVEDILPAACWLLADDSGAFLRHRGSSVLDLNSNVTGRLL
jgi:hypothetical protein